jgi:hypothetical protein
MDPRNPRKYCLKKKKKKKKKKFFPKAAVLKTETLFRAEKNWVLRLILFCTLNLFIIAPKLVQSENEKFTTISRFF